MIYNNQISRKFSKLSHLFMAFLCIQLAISCGAKEENSDSGNTGSDQKTEETNGAGSDKGSENKQPTENPDKDNDGIKNTEDNCPLKVNPEQTDTDGDLSGDICDDDDDGDGIADDVDNCPLTNPESAGQDKAYQGDLDFDGIGDICDEDRDGDGVPNETDNCPDVSNRTQKNIDGDEKGNACDTDVDGDNVLVDLNLKACNSSKTPAVTTDCSDNCPYKENADQKDADDDGIGDACDNDDDNDGVDNISDNCKVIYNPDQINSDAKLSDGDELGDACDDDDDNDKILDVDDNCPLKGNVTQKDSDLDGTGDACDSKDDRLPKAKVCDAQTTSSCFVPGLRNPTTAENVSYTLVGDEIYVTGGKKRSVYTADAAVKEVKVYNIVTKLWSSKKDMPMSKTGHSGIVLGDLIYFAGGDKWDKYANYSSTYDEVDDKSFWSYNYKTDTWAQLSNMPYTLGSDYDKSVIDGTWGKFYGYLYNNNSADPKFYIFGTADPSYSGTDHEPMRKINVFDVNGQAVWKEASNAEIPKIKVDGDATEYDLYHMINFSYGSKIYLFGGFYEVEGANSYSSDQIAYTKMLSYDTTTETWGTEETLTWNDGLTGLRFSQPVVIGDKVYLFGGESYDPTGTYAYARWNDSFTVLSLDMTTKTISKVGDLIRKRTKFSVFKHENAGQTKVYIIGGNGEFSYSSDPMNIIDIFVP